MPALAPNRATKAMVNLGTLRPFDGMAAAPDSDFEPTKYPAVATTSFAIMPRVDFPGKVPRSPLSPRHSRRRGSTFEAPVALEKNREYRAARHVTSRMAEFI